MLVVEFFSQSHHQVVVFYWISYFSNFVRYHSVLKQVCHLRPIKRMFVEVSFWFTVVETGLGIRRFSSFARRSILICLFILHVQQTWLLWIIRFVLKLNLLRNHLDLIDLGLLHFTSLRILLVRLQNVLLVKLLCPFLWNAILNLVFHGNFIRAPGKSLSQWLFVELIELLVKLCYHRLNTWILFFLIQLVVYGYFDIFFSVKTLLHISCVRFVFQNFTYFCTCVSLKQNQVLIVNFVQLISVYVYVAFTLQNMLVGISSCVAASKSHYI